MKTDRCVWTKGYRTPRQNELLIFFDDSVSLFLEFDIPSTAQDYLRMNIHHK